MQSAPKGRLDRVFLGFLVYLKGLSEVGSLVGRWRGYGCSPSRPRAAGVALLCADRGSGDPYTPRELDRVGGLFWLVSRADPCSVE